MPRDRQKRCFSPDSKNVKFAVLVTGICPFASGAEDEVRRALYVESPIVDLSIGRGIDDCDVFR